MAAKKVKKTKKPKYVWPKRKQNEEILKVKDKLSNADVIKRLSLDKDEKIEFNKVKTGKGKWTITLAVLTLLNSIFSSLSKDNLLITSALLSLSLTFRISSFCFRLGQTYFGFFVFLTFLAAIYSPLTEWILIIIVSIG
jgi:hypothetical protein